MKAKDYIIIGGAVALFLYWKNKNKKVGTSTTTTGGSTTNGTTTTGGSTTGIVVVGTPIKGGGKGNAMPTGLPLVSYDFNLGTKNPNAGTSQVTVLETPPPSNEPEQVFGVGLPSGMDLPVLTAGNGVPTEVAVQQGGVNTTPEPIYVNPPPLGIEDSLILAGIKPIVKPFKPNSPVYEIPRFPFGMNTIKDPIIIVPKEKPKLYIEQY